MLSTASYNVKAPILSSAAVMSCRIVLLPCLGRREAIFNTLTYPLPSDQIAVAVLLFLKVDVIDDIIVVGRPVVRLR